MNEIEFKNGHHIDVTTMDFIQEAYTKPIEALVSAAEGQNFIVSGMSAGVGYVPGHEGESAYARLKVENGYVVLSGKFMEFRGGLCSANTTIDNLYVKASSETSGNENADGNTYQVLKKTYAEISTQSQGAVLYKSLTFPRPMLSIPNVEDAEITTSFDVPTFGENTGQWEVYKDYLTPSYSIYSNTLTIYGVFKTDTFITEGQNTLKLGTLPNWPGGLLYGIKCYWYTVNSITRYLGFCYINAAGDLILEKPNNGPQGKLHSVMFDGTPHPLIARKP